MGIRLGLDDYNGSGAFLVKFNLFWNAPADAIDMSVGAIKPTIQNNVFSNIGTDASSHPDTVQFVGGAVSDALVEFNTVYQPQRIAQQGMQGIQAWGALGGLTDVKVSNNVIVASGPLLTMSYSIAVGHDERSTIDGVVVVDNYIDTSGCSRPLLSPERRQPEIWKNWNMVTGGLFPERLRDKRSPEINGGSILPGVG